MNESVELLISIVADQWQEREREGSNDTMQGADKHRHRGVIIQDDEPVIE